MNGGRMERDAGKEREIKGVRKEREREMNERLERDELKEGEREMKATTD